MIDSISEMLEFPLRIERKVDSNTEWKEIQQSNRRVFVKLQDIKDRNWLSRHKPLYFDGLLRLSEEDRASTTYSGGFTYAFCLPLFIAWYHYENGTPLIEAIQRSVIKRNPTLDQVKKGRSLVESASRGFYHEREYGMFGPATPAIVSLFWEGDLAEAYEQANPPGFYSLLAMYLGSISGDFLCRTKGWQWNPGRFMRERALEASHHHHLVNNDFLTSQSRTINQRWKTILSGDWDPSGRPPNMLAIKEETERQLREDIRSGALAGWLAEIIADGIDI